MTQTAQTDRIEQEVRIQAPRARVWKALTDSKEFGAWFGAEVSEPFAPGRSVAMRMRGDSACTGKTHPEFEIHIERVEPEEVFSFRWHPYAVDPKVDYAQEPTTLVEFRLSTTPAGTLVRVVESGFDRIPPGRRVEAFRMNTKGWAIQLENVKKHVTG